MSEYKKGAEKSKKGKDESNFAKVANSAENGQTSKQSNGIIENGITNKGEELASKISNESDLVAPSCCGKGSADGHHHHHHHNPISGLSGADNEAILKHLTNLMLTSPGDGFTKSVDNQPEKKTKEDYKFWRTQPVPDLDEAINDNVAIEEDKSFDELRKEPYSLPSGFYWSDVVLDNPDQLKELYDLLYENYVEDDDHLFRFDYSCEFLEWALKPPGWRPEWHVGLRAERNDKLFGFIGATPCEMQIYEKRKDIVEINFLCVHKRLRSKRMAPVLIREITRRVNLTGRFQAAYTSGVLLPKPVAVCRYYHRPLNPRKLIEVGFSQLSRNMTIHLQVKLFKIPNEPQTKRYREMKEADVLQTYALLAKYLEKFKLHPVFTEEEFRHWFIPKAGIVNTYIVENEAGKITDMTSFYTLPSTVMKSKTHTNLMAAYSFYNVSTETPWTDLMRDSLISAKQLGFDVYNALNLMDNASFLQNLKFGIGDGNLHYYLYNWRCPSVTPEEIGVVLQ